VVVVDADDPAADRLRTEVAQGGRTIEAWLAPRDVDELAAIVESSGDVEVVFPELGAFLEALWSGRVPLPIWRRVRIRCAARVGEVSDDVIRRTLDAWEVFTTTAARRQRGAALILSAIAIASAAVLLLLE
jgi:hypothetical protein